MSNPQPIRYYVEAVTALRNGQQEEAAELLTKAIGANETNAIVRNNVAKLLEPNTLANDGILGLVANQVARRGEEDVG